jgi:hypothetical protein
MQNIVPDIGNTDPDFNKTRLKLKLHKPAARLSMYQSSAYYNNTTIYNKLPDDLAELQQKISRQ